METNVANSRLTEQKPGTLSFSDKDGRVILLTFRSGTVNPEYDPANPRRGIINGDALDAAGEIILTTADGEIILDRPLLRELAPYFAHMAQFGSGDPNGAW